MNKVGCAIMDTVIMAIVTKALPIIGVMAQFRIILNWLDMVCFQVAVTVAHLARIIITFQDRFFPGQVFRAAPPLILSVVFALCYALAFLPTINVFALPLTYAGNESFTANFTRKPLAITAAFMGTIDIIPYVRWASFNLFPTGCTFNNNFLRLADCIASARTKPLLNIFIPIPINLFRNDLPANLTSLHSLRMRSWFKSFNPLVSAGLRAVFSSTIILYALSFVKQYFLVTDLTVSYFHTPIIQGN